MSPGVSTDAPSGVPAALLVSIPSSDPVGLPPGRLIDDNPRTVQYLIAKYRTADEGIALVFLDQEKAYDRVSHKFMWKVLRRFGVSREFIDWIKALYKDARIKIFINGFLSSTIQVPSGVRQGDPLSCPLFVVVIEALARFIDSDPLIRGIQVGPQIIKTLQPGGGRSLMLDPQSVRFSIGSEGELGQVIHPDARAH